MTVRKNMPHRKKAYVLLTFCLVLIGMVFAKSSPVCASTSKSYTNSQTGYQLIVEDEAELLSASDDEWKTFYATLGEITESCNIGFYSTYDNPYSSTDRLAEEKNEEFFGLGSDSIIFVIDMEYRNIYIDSMGSMKRYITKAHANTITDNTYRYASKADYFGCANEAFSEILSLLKGRRLSQPMKYISNILLAIILAMLANFFIVKVLSARHKPNRQELFTGLYKGLTVNDPRTGFINQTKEYSPQSSGGGGGHSGGGHSGGGGGGHSGGGHHF